MGDIGGFALEMPLHQNGAAGAAGAGGGGGGASSGVGEEEEGDAERKTSSSHQIDPQFMTTPQQQRFGTRLAAIASPSVKALLHEKDASTLAFKVNSDSVAFFLGLFFGCCAPIANV
jgi:hypothetical protein